MDSGRMHRLGKLLIQMSAALTGAPDEIALPQGEAVILQEVLEDPGISIKEIHDRTGLSQSHVAESMTRLKHRGMLVTDPPRGSAWQSSTRVQASDSAMQTISDRQSRPVDEAVIRVVNDPAKAGRAIRLMDELADILS
jgi:Winged helix-turn-helix DNA-binding